MPQYDFSLSLTYRLSELGALSEKLASQIISGDIIGFRGDLGCGKTTCIRSLVSSLGSRHEVTSPTYSMENQYKGTSFLVRHWDLYRGIEEYEEDLIFDSEYENSVLLVEWPDCSHRVLDRVNILLEFDFVDSKHHASDATERALTIYSTRQLALLPSELSKN